MIDSENYLPQEIYDRVGKPKHNGSPHRHNFLLAAIYDGATQRVLMTESEENSSDRSLKRGKVSVRDLTILGTYIFTDASLEEVGTQFGFISRERPRQINKVVIRKIYRECSPEIRELFLGKMPLILNETKKHV